MAADFVICIEDALRRRSLAIGIFSISGGSATLQCSGTVSLLSDTFSP